MATQRRRGAQPTPTSFSGWGAGVTTRPTPHASKFVAGSPAKGAGTKPGKPCGLVRRSWMLMTGSLHSVCIRFPSCGACHQPNYSAVPLKSIAFLNAQMY